MVSSPPDDGSILPEGWKWSDVGHGVLDIAGLVPGYGEAADITNAAWYAQDEQYLDAGLSLISCVPIVGDAIGKGGKLAGKLGGPALKKLLPLIRKMDFAQALAPFRNNRKLGPSIDKMVEALNKWRDDLIAKAECKTACPLPKKSAAEVSARAKHLAGELATATGAKASAIADELADLSTHTMPGAERIVLGKWPGYIEEAKKAGGTWFETPPDFFDELKRATGSADLAKEKAWLVNEAFLRKQFASGLPVEMTGEGLDWAAAEIKSMTARELKFLNENAGAAGYTKGAAGSWIKGK